MKCDAGCSGTASTESNVAWVAAKLRDMPLHPLQDLSLITEAIVGKDFIAVCHEPVWTNAIVEAHNDDAVAAAYYQTRCICVGVRIETEATALDVEEDGKFRSGRG